MCIYYISNTYWFIFSNAYSRWIFFAIFFASLFVLLVCWLSIIIDFPDADSSTCCSSDNLLLIWRNEHASVAEPIVSRNVVPKGKRNQQFCHFDALKGSFFLSKELQTRVGTVPRSTSSNWRTDTVRTMASQDSVFIETRQIQIQITLTNMSPLNVGLKVIISIASTQTPSPPWKSSIYIECVSFIEYYEVIISCKLNSHLNHRWPTIIMSPLMISKTRNYLEFIKWSFRLLQLQILWLGGKLISTYPLMAQSICLFQLQALLLKGHSVCLVKWLMTTEVDYHQARFKKWFLFTKSCNNDNVINWKTTCQYSQFQHHQYQDLKIHGTDPTLVNTSICCQRTFLETLPTIATGRILVHVFIYHLIQINNAWRNDFKEWCYFYYNGFLSLNKQHRDS